MKTLRKTKVFELKKFQTEAATLVANRYAFFANHHDRPKKGNTPRPFFQALSALTGAGKTPILAHSVSLMRAYLPTEPIVFWMSKAKSVVAQTYQNFSIGGKYRELIDGFKVINIHQLTPAAIFDNTTPLIIMATTGLFNNVDQDEGSLNIYKKDEDGFGDLSPWERLIDRSSNGVKRPLIIVYDEGHNLSEQQTNLLANLEPDAYLLASATMKLPANFNKTVIQHIKLWIDEATDDSKSLSALGAVDSHGNPDIKRFITTTIQSGNVVDEQLVKKAIQFNGTTASMEKCVDDLLARLNQLVVEIEKRSLGFIPKAIYVCKTNVSDDGEKDDYTKPFIHRKAPPIKIWRYLVEEKNIDPRTIAIYANLNYIDGNMPDEVNLYTGGENDFDDFSAHEYQHIIFNLSLQEGWDDPACYLAYIDKSMGSAIQVEQVIGRVLRQYNARHYDAAMLNTAHFYLRVDSREVFSKTILSVKAKLENESVPIEITETYGGTGTEDCLPKSDQKIQLCNINIDAESACEFFRDAINHFPTFTEGSKDTIGIAQKVSQTLDLKRLESGAEDIPDWKASGNTNLVRLRWVINTALRARSAGALAIADFSDAKFDVRVQMQSNACIAAEKLAIELAEIYYQQAELIYETLRPFDFGLVHLPSSAISFKNGLYPKYYGFNNEELDLANALDKLGYAWHRNPVNGGFHIPLLTDGNTSSFYPDFIVWKNSKVYCLDTKGAHLLTDAVARKLFDISDGGKVKVYVRFICQGKQNGLQEKTVKGGYTVWKMKNGTPTPVFLPTIDDATKECLK
jgi:type III restriction enzyme